MNEKKFALAISLVFALAAIIPFVHAATAEYSNLIEISQTTYLPASIRSGDTVSLALAVHNRATLLPVIDLNAQLELGNQFEPVKPSDFISLISPDSTKTLVFSFRVKPGTIAGYYPLFVNLIYLRDNQPVSQKETLAIPVFKTQKNIDVSVSPNVISPSSPTTIVFSLQNLSETSISNISLSWQEKNNLVLPLGTDNKRYIDQLEADSNVPVSYTVVADPNIATGVYSLDVTVSFVDNNGTQIQTSQVGLVVGGTTDFEASIDNQTSGQLSVSIANIGSNNAGAVVVKILPQDGIRIVGSNVAILGNLNKGDFTLANFQVPTVSIDQNQGSGFGAGRRAGGTTGTGGTSGTGGTGTGGTGFSPASQTLKVTIDYTDTTGQRQSVVKEVALNATTGNANIAATQFQQRNNLSWLPWALLAVIGLGGIAYNYFRSKKDWKKFGLFLIIVIALFLASVYLFAASLISAAVAGILSFGILIWFFKRKQNGG
ncbi:MAG: hypothetical protein V1777_02890 [Candidatus Micrarchaeota archaeon]